MATSRTSDEEQGNPSSQDEFVDPQISVTVRVERGGWLLASVVSAVLIATFFLATAPYISAWDERPVSVECEQLPSADASEQPLPSVSAAECSAAVDEALDTDPAAFTGALLGVVSLVVVRSGEHAYTARLVRGVRVVSVAVASFPLVGAWLIVFPGPGELLEWGWGVLAAASVAATLLLVGAFRAGAR